MYIYLDTPGYSLDLPWKCAFLPQARICGFSDLGLPSPFSWPSTSRCSSASALCKKEDMNHYYRVIMLFDDRFIIMVVKIPPAATCRWEKSWKFNIFQLILTPPHHSSSQDNRHYPLLLLLFFHLLILDWLRCHHPQGVGDEVWREDEAGSSECNTHIPSHIPTHISSSHPLTHPKLHLFLTSTVFEICEWMDVIIGRISIDFDGFLLIFVDFRC